MGLDPRWFWNDPTVPQLPPQGAMPGSPQGNTSGYAPPLPAPAPGPAPAATSPPTQSGEPSRKP